MNHLAGCPPPALKHFFPVSSHLISPTWITHKRFHTTILGRTLTWECSSSFSHWHRGPVMTASLTSNFLLLDSVMCLMICLQRPLPMRHASKQCCPDGRSGYLQYVLSKPKAALVLYGNVKRHEVVVSESRLLFGTEDQREVCTTKRDGLKVTHHTTGGKNSFHRSGMNFHLSSILK